MKPGTSSEPPPLVQGRMQAWRTLEADPALSAFFSFVEHEGDEAWQKERARVGRTFIATTRDLSNEVRRGLNHLRAVRHLIPTWRQWGEALMEG